MNHDVMVDLETLDTKPTAIILSIGACLVNWDKGEPTNDFYRTIEVQSCKDVGLTESVDTRRWWDKQSAEARKVFTDPTVQLEVALIDFAKYLSSFNKSKVRLWGNGSDFDNTIIANAYDALGLDAPWKFYNNRCFRTVRKVMGGQFEEPTRAGTYHNALDDAKHQARILLAMDLSPYYTHQ